MDEKILDEEKNNILQQFRMNMSDLLQSHHDDRFLLRWLRARDFNIREAEKMLRNDFKMRKKLNAENIRKHYKVPEVTKSYLATTLLGFSKMGHPVRFSHVGKWDVKGLLKSMTYQDMILSATYILEGDIEELEKHNKETGNDVDTWVVIADFTELHFAQWCSTEVYRLGIFLTKMYQDHYPETLHCLFGINTPAVIVYVANVILKPFIAEKVFNKVRLYSPGDDSYKEELFSLVPKEIVPAYIGGERYEPEGDPTCDGLLHRKGKVPLSLYLKNQMNLIPDDPKVKQKIVRERSTFEVKEDITVPGTVLCWEFQTKEHNIKFGLFYKTPQINCDKNFETTVEELLPVQSTESNILVEQGEYVCAKEGIYILHFDNKYSWLRSKHLFYKVEIHQPDAGIAMEEQNDSLYLGLP